jgi:hypothetical protein
MTSIRPISEARSADLRGSLEALKRAARRARRVAEHTGTAIVVVRNGKLEHVYPPFAPVVREAAEGYGKES